jgi:DNA invertase Pin-like site-specific DNA recombinase/ACT domain-containing protein
VVNQNEQTDLKKLRYALYVRKSTEDENRQVRSIDDQIKDCRKVAASLGLHIVGDPIEERKSAKKPNQRLLFTKMLRDIEAKKYDAILCWHPDRLCRNMLEGGEIINMLDEGTLKDIRFHSHQFSNDANGKMLLGMLFVFSKQYSDDLSAKVSRGVKGNFSEGKSSGSPKFGYDRNEQDGLYKPNQFFNVVQEAWQRRVQGDSLEAITNILIKKGYERVTKNKGQPRLIKPSITAISTMFRDPFYYGLLVQANQNVDLRTVYDFQPMVDEDTYNQVQLLSQGRTKDKFTKKRATFYPLHGFVYCAVCNNPKYMLVGKNLSGSKEHVLTYRCDNPACTRKPKSMRAKNIFNSMYEMLDGIELTDEAYARYSKRIDGMTDSKLIGIKQDIQSRRGALTHIVSELDQRALSMGVMDKKSPVYMANEKRVNELAIQQADSRQKIDELEAKVTNPNRIKLSKAEFLNVIKTASDKMKAGTPAEKDTLCRILFLNVHVDNEKVVDYLWKEPFASLVKAVELSSGRDDRI